jgi:hypothetical protein
MIKHIIILLLISLNLSAQDLEIDKSPQPYRMIFTNIAAVSLDAIGDGLRDEAWATHNSNLSKWGHLAHVGSTGLLISVPLGQNFDLHDWFIYASTYLATRVAIFDPVYNITRGLPWDYHGNSSIWDNFMGQADSGDGLMVMRTVSFTFAVSYPISSWETNKQKKRRARIIKDSNKH